MKLNGLVVKKSGDKFSVEVANEIYVCTSRGILKTQGVFVGDKVEIDEKEQNIENVFPRKNQLIRPPLVNLDQLLIILADKPKPDYLMLDKLLLFCKVYDIKPIICLTKIDLSNKNEKYLQAVYGEHFEVVCVSALVGTNINKLKEMLMGKVSALTGQSGVGKSALTNILFGKPVAEEGFLSKRIERGKNTTRHCKLFKLDNNSYVADTAGFSSLDEKLLPIDCYELPYYYPDFLSFLKDCKYKSCTHTNEIDCGIKLAVKNGSIDKERYERYLIIFSTLLIEYKKLH